MRKKIIFIFIGLILYNSTIFAGVPAKINYRGKLYLSGQPVSGQKLIYFKIFDSGTNGNELWNNGLTPVPVTCSSGVFTYTLEGGSPTLNASIFTNKNLYLEIEIQGIGGPMTPREQIVSVGFAFNADMVDGIHGYSLVPIGAIIAWHKNLPGTPSLPQGFVECNGQPINDLQSPYNGINVPDLNNQNRFLRGNINSGGTGGTNTHSHIYTNVPIHTHTINDPGHSHGYRHMSTASPSENYADGTRGGNYNDTTTSSTTGITINQSGVASPTTEPASSLPPFFNIVWIIRIK